MRKHIPGIAKAVTDYAGLHANLVVAHEVMTDLADKCRKDMDTRNPSQTGAVGMLCKAIDAHRQLCAASAKLHDAYQSAHKAISAVSGIANANAGPASSGLAGNQDLTSAGEESEGLKVAKIHALMRKHTRQGILDTNAFMQALMKSTLMTTDLAKRIQSAVGYVNPNSRGNPMWEPPEVSNAR